MRVMLLIDADNVSMDIVEQALDMLKEQHGAVHVRRAYCTAESALKQQALFKRLSIRPMVNLSAGKNSTDIALAVDAMYLVLVERPDIVAIASSDSDFAPLVTRLREQGCRVLGIGQEGKTGDETRAVYDDFTVLSHRKGGAAAGPKAPARRAPAKKAAPKPARETSPKPAARSAAKAASKGVAKESTKTARGRAAPSAAPAPADTAQALLDCLPELELGETLELRVASARLRAAGLLSRSGSSTKLFSRYAERFDLVPSGQPNHVRLRRAR